MEKVISASEAIAQGVRLCKPKVIAAYPITPQTIIVEKLAESVNNSELNASMIEVESEHSAMSAVLGAAVTGVRTFTATSSQGLALMYEVLPIMSGMRLPSVMAVANRALSAPINIWNDHSDSVSARDQGWIQLWVESSQEALDTVIQGYKISENKKVCLPLMVNLDGFTLSHVFEPVEIPKQSAVDTFLPEHSVEDFLDTEKPKTFGPIGFPNSFMEFKKMQQDAFKESIPVIKKVHSNFSKTFKRSYGNGLIEEFELKDAEYAIIGMGTLVGTAREAVKNLRKKGEKFGLIKLKSLRPFPVEELIKATKNLKGLIAIDRHISLGFEGALASDLKAAILPIKPELKIKGFIAGLGGRDITLQHLEKALLSIKRKDKNKWLL